jgi:hypothetical protein
MDDVDVVDEEGGNHHHHHHHATVLLLLLLLFDVDSAIRRCRNRSLSFFLWMMAMALILGVPVQYRVTNKRTNDTAPQPTQLFNNKLVL